MAGRGGWKGMAGRSGCIKLNGSNGYRRTEVRADGCVSNESCPKEKHLVKMDIWHGWLGKTSSKGWLG